MPVKCLPDYAKSFSGKEFDLQPNMIYFIAQVHGAFNVTLQGDGSAKSYSAYRFEPVLDLTPLERAAYEQD
jgi:hypothetical protein